MPTARSWAGAAVVDGKIYVTGGMTVVPRQGTAAVEEYDPTTDTWTEKADMPTARGWLATSVVNGIIYAIGGWSEGTFFSVVEAYDPAADKWIRKANMPTPREPCTVTVDGKIYAIGGLVAQQGTPVTVSTVEVYDPTTDRWTRKADMPTARERHTACVLDGRIYVSGGVPTHSSVDPAVVALTTVEVYDPTTDTWTQASDMPWPKYGHSASVIDGKMYIIGGQDQESVKLWQEGQIDEGQMDELFSIVYVYDPAADTWTTAARHPFVTTAHAAGVVDGKIYTIGGVRNDPYSIVYEYDPGLPDNIAITNPAGKLLTTWGKVRAAE
jgi:N-acetylneuraminic acid mutarotase